MKLTNDGAVTTGCTGNVTLDISEMNTDTYVQGRYQRVGKVRNYGLIEVYKGIDMKTGEEVEIEQIGTVYPELEHEARVYRDLAGGVGIPSVHWCGIDGDHYILVHDALGPSLKDILQFGRFSLNTVTTLAMQLITRLETIHDRGIVYGNMNLDNLRMGIGKRSRQVHVVNFDHAQRYKYLSYSHLPLVEKSVREDIESLGYTVVALLDLDSLPLEFTTYLDYSNSLKINQRPDYSYLRQLVQGLLSRDDSIQPDFDWTKQLDGIFTNLVAAEERCLDIQRQQNSTNEALSDEQLRQFFTLHEALLNGHYDFFAAYNPSSSTALRDLQDKYGIPTRLWRHGIYTFFEMLNKGLPETLDHMRRFLRVSYTMVAVLMETAPTFESTWIEYLKRLAGYRMDVEKANKGDWEVWSDVVKLWHEKADYQYESARKKGLPVEPSI